MRRDARLLRHPVAGFIVAGLACALLAFGLTKRLRYQADSFVSEVRHGRFDQARDRLAESLRNDEGEAWLRRTLSESGILNTRAAQWTEQKSGSGYGELSGELTQRDGRVVPVTLLFAREGVDWRLYSIRRPFTAEPPQPIEPPLPDHLEQIALVKRAIQDFSASVRSRDMSYFRTTLTAAKQDLYSTEKLDVAFGHFFDMEEDLTSLADVEPTFEPYTEDAKGEVTLRGVFPTEPKRVYFQQKYAYEKADWRLLSFAINVK